MNISGLARCAGKILAGKEDVPCGRVIDAVSWTSAALIAWLFLHLSRSYITPSAQFAVGWGAVLVLFALKRFEKVKKPPLRIFFIVLSFFLTVRYVVWRSTETLVYTGPLDFLAMMALYLAEMYAIALHTMGIFTNIWPLEHKIMPLPADESVYPTVDVFIPTYSEPVDIVKVTAIAAMRIDYPKDRLRVHILDDGASVAKRNDPHHGREAWARYYDFKKLAGELGVGYITRPKNLKAKAGNLTHALGHTDGELVLVLDCDHVPTSDILKNTAGWFLKDEKIAFVQTPHFFINPNPIEKNVQIFKDAPSENDMFYRGIHPGLDMWNSSYFCGSAALLRRKCLEEIGGISGETITEDCETALSLHRRGYKSVYIPRPMVCGLSPETFDDLIVQKSRWAQGMAQILLLNNPLFAKGLRFYQRLCYFNSCFYWFFGISRVIFYLAPAAFLLLNLKVYFASVPQVLAFAVPHVVGSVILTGFLYGRFRWPFFSEFFEGIQSLFLMPVIFSVLLNPRKPSFRVTPKGKSLDKDFISGFAVYFLLLNAVLIVAIPAAVVKWFEYPVYRDITTITLVWCVLNLLLAMASFGAFFERRQVRRHHRMWARGKALAYVPRLGIKVEARLDDVSLSGVGLVLDLPLPPAPLELVVLETRNSFGKKFRLETRVRRHHLHHGLYVCGCEFLTMEKNLAEAVDFVYGDSQRWADFWAQKTKPANPAWIAAFVCRSVARGFKIFLITLVRFIVAPALARAVRPLRRPAGVRPAPEPQEAA